jgi:hypothetical protein
MKSLKNILINKLEKAKKKKNKKNEDKIWEKNR